MTNQEIKDRSPDGATHYIEYLERLITQKRMVVIIIGGILEQEIGIRI